VAHDSMVKRTIHKRSFIQCDLSGLPLPPKKFCYLPVAVVYAKPARGGTLLYKPAINFGKAKTAEVEELFQWDLLSGHQSHDNSDDVRKLVAFIGKHKMTYISWRAAPSLMVGPDSPDSPGSPGSSGSPGSPGRKIHVNFRTGRDRRDRRARRGRKARPDGKITESPRRQKGPPPDGKITESPILYTY